VPAERGATKRGVHLGNQLFEGVLLRAERAREIAIKPVRGAAGVPGMNGLEVLRRLRRWGIADPVIFLTMLSDDIYEEAALEGGAIDFIEKSRRPSILVRRLRLLAEGARLVPEAGGLPAEDVLRLAAWSCASTPISSAGPAR
jgi:DNA-binding response OmpR family regulator